LVASKNPQPTNDNIVTVRNATFNSANGVYTFCDELDGSVGGFTRIGHYKGDATEFHITRWLDESTGGYVWSIARLITSDNTYFDHYTTQGSSEQSVPPSGAVWKCVHSKCIKCASPIVTVSRGDKQAVLKNDTPKSSDILPGKIFIGNLPVDLTDEQLMEIVSVYGRVKQMNQGRDAGATLTKGFAFCEYVDPSAAQAAIRGLNGFHMGAKVFTARAVTAVSSKRG
jgi:hypothetical protein